VKRVVRDRGLGPLTAVYCLVVVLVALVALVAVDFILVSSVPCGRDFMNIEKGFQFLCVSIFIMIS